MFGKALIKADRDFYDLGYNLKSILQVFSYEDLWTLYFIKQRIFELEMGYVHFSFHSALEYCTYFDLKHYTITMCF
jgi:hypothetical protein